MISNSFPIFTSSSDTDMTFNAVFSRRWLIMVAATVSTFLFTGCPPVNPVPSFPAGEVQGLKPVYLESGNAYEIKLLSARALERPGKIYVYGHFLFINELHKGIHVIDNKNPEAPLPLYFIQVYGNVDMAIKDHFLYADNINDLVVLNISDPENFQVTERIKNVFPGVAEYPFDTGNYFECPDPAKGVVVGWEKATLKNPECYR